MKARMAARMLTQAHEESRVIRIRMGSGALYQGLLTEYAHLELGDVTILLDNTWTLTGRRTGVEDITPIALTLARVEAIELHQVRSTSPNHWDR